METMTTPPAAAGSLVTDAQAQQLMVLSAMVSRMMMGRQAGLTFGGQRDVAGVLGYKAELEFDDYLLKYRRQDVAGRIVDKPAADTWRHAPWIWDSDRDEETPFVEDLNRVARRCRLWHYLGRVDRLAGIGRYAVLVLGLRDGQDLDQPVRRLRGPEDLLYLGVYSERHAEIGTWQDDPREERFGRPLTYKVKVAGDNPDFRPRGLGAGGTQEVHWTRILHVAENLEEDEVFGRPRLQRVFDRLDDMLKIAGGSAEIFWLVARHTLHLDIDKDVEVGDLDLKELDSKLQELAHHLRNVIQTQGAKLTAIGGDDVDPRGAFEVAQLLVAAAAEMPVRILFGSERGELASQQDQEAWRAQITARRQLFAEPMVIRPLVDRLIEYGVVRPPQGGEYYIDWPPQVEPTPDKMAETGEKAARAAAALRPDNPEAVLPPWELREHYLGLTPLPPPPPETEGLGLDDVQVLREEVAELRAIIETLARGQAAD